MTRTERGAATTTPQRPGASLAPSTGPLQPSAANAAAVSSAALLQGGNVVRIEHNGALYELRSTRLGKLILTK